MLNTFHPSDVHNSYLHGESLSEAIELALAVLERIAPNTDAAAKCTIAEAIIENAGQAGAYPEWAEVYRGARENSPRYAAAERAYAGRVA